MVMNEGIPLCNNREAATFVTEFSFIVQKRLRLIGHWEG